MYDVNMLKNSITHNKHNKKPYSSPRLGLIGYSEWDQRIIQSNQNVTADCRQHYNLKHKTRKSDDNLFWYFGLIEEILRRSHKD